MLIYQNEALKIHCLLLNELKTNCYVVQKGSEALLVDPVDKAELIVDYLRQHQLTLKFMLATHGHFDHVSAAADIIERGLVNALYLHEKDFDEVKNAKSYSLMILKKKMCAPQVRKYDSDFNALMQTWELGIEHIGGHTRGSCYIYGLARDFVIAGDLALHHKLNITLFDSRENTAEIFRFIEQLKRLFKAETVIFPGHGEATTVGVELEKNKKWAYVQQKECHGH